MTKADLIALAERVERADAAQQAELIADAWDMLGPIRHWTAEQAARFAKMLDAEAYESAAMTLVPDSCLMMARHLWDGDQRARHAVINRYGKSGEEPDGKMWLADYSAVAATPSLALTAASLRAIAEEMDG